jgi:hypothetical protein
VLILKRSSAGLDPAVLQPVGEQFCIGQGFDPRTVEGLAGSRPAAYPARDREASHRSSRVGVPEPDEAAVSPAEICVARALAAPEFDQECANTSTGLADPDSQSGVIIWRRWRG